MKKLFAIVAVMGVLTFGSTQLAQAQDAPAAEQTDKLLLLILLLLRKLLLRLTKLLLHLLVLKKVVFTKNLKLSSSRVLHSS